MEIIFIAILIIFFVYLYFVYTYEWCYIAQQFVKEYPRIDKECHRCGMCFRGWDKWKKEEIKILKGPK